MTVRSAHERWLHLRWRHYYQWKHLLMEEQQARRQLAHRHQQQTNQVLLQTTNNRVALVIKEQLVSLARLRSQLQQKRLGLRAVQAQQMDASGTELAQTGTAPSYDLFRTFSVLRQP